MSPTKATTLLIRTRGFPQGKSIIPQREASNNHFDGGFIMSNQTFCNELLELCIKLDKAGAIGNQINQMYLVGDASENYLCLQLLSEIMQDYVVGTKEQIGKLLDRIEFSEPQEDIA